MYNKCSEEDYIGCVCGVAHTCDVVDSEDVISGRLQEIGERRDTVIPLQLVVSIHFGGEILS